MNLIAMEVIGTVGGTMIALSLLPQAIYTYKTKSAGDISYVYQAIYICGTTLVNIYAIVLGLWPVYIPCLIEESLIITLTVMKLLYDRNDRRDVMLDSHAPTQWSARRTDSMRNLDLGQSWRRSSVSGSARRFDSMRNLDLGPWRRSSVSGRRNSAKSSARGLAIPVDTERTTTQLGAEISRHLDGVEENIDTEMKPVVDDEEVKVCDEDEENGGLTNEEVDNIIHEDVAKN